MLATNAMGGITACIRIAYGATYAVEAIASLIVRAVFVVLANAGYTRDQRIALGAYRAGACSSVVLGPAFSIVTALRVGIIGAWIQAFVIVAGLVVGTVVVALAFG